MSSMSYWLEDIFDSTPLALILPFCLVINPIQFRGLAFFVTAVISCLNIIIIIAQESWR